MSTVAEVTTALKTQLDAISTTKVKTVLKGRNRQNTGFPYVRFYLDDYASEMVSGASGDASSHWPNIMYRIEIIGELSTTKTAAKKEDDFQEAVETVTAKLEEEYRLNTSDIIFSIVGESAREIQLGEGLVVMLPLVVTIRTFRSYT